MTELDENFRIHMQYAPMRHLHIVCRVGLLAQRPIGVQLEFTLTIRKIGRFR